MTMYGRFHIYSQTWADFYGITNVVNLQNYQCNVNLTENTFYT